MLFRSQKLTMFMVGVRVQAERVTLLARFFSLSSIGPKTNLIHCIIVERMDAKFHCFMALYVFLCIFEVKTLKYKPNVTQRAYGVEIRLNFAYTTNMGMHIYWPNFM